MSARLVYNGVASSNWWLEQVNVAGIRTQTDTGIMYGVPLDLRDVAKALGMSVARLCGELSGLDHVPTGAQVAAELAHELRNVAEVATNAAELSRAGELTPVEVADGLLELAAKVTNISELVEVLPFHEVH